MKVTWSGKTGIKKFRKIKKGIFWGTKMVAEILIVMLMKMINSTTKQRWNMQDRRMRYRDIASTPCFTEWSLKRRISMIR